MAEEAKDRKIATLQKQVDAMQRKQVKQRSEIARLTQALEQSESDRRHAVMELHQARDTIKSLK